jgi:serine/threonine-protein kinase
VEGTPFGRYRLVELLGRGGMGDVWRAYDPATDRIVAIKVLPAHLSDDETFQQRFRREAHAAARLNNPHIIPIHFYGEIDGRLYVDMRLIEGRDLQSVLVDGPLEPARAVRIVEQVAKALHAAHKVGLVHRDVKPPNILLDDDDEYAYLIDFGIARATEETRLTKTGNTIGTFHYMAPERLNDRAGDDARADIYALACVFYECLTGRPPFDGASLGSLVAAHLTAAPPRPSASQPNVPLQLDEVVATGMAKDPDQRYATTVEFANAARDAITVPIHRPAPRPPQDSPAAQAPSPVTTPMPGHNWPPHPQPSTFAPAVTEPEQLPTHLARSQWTSNDGGGTAPWVAPPGPHMPAEMSSVSRPNRRTRMALIVGGFALVAVIAVVVGVIVVIGHKSTPSARPSPSSTAASSQVAALPLSDWVGTWHGPVTGDDRPYDIDVVLTADGQNLGGRVSYPQLGCGGTWTEISRDGNVREFKEVITYQGTCLSGVQIRVTNNGNSLSYQTMSTSRDIRARLSRAG